MNGGEKLAFTAVNEHATRNHGNRPDDIIEIRPVSSAEEQVSSEAARATQKRYRLILKVVQRINMLFLVLFVCYFTWTLAASSGHTNNNTGDRVTANTSAHNTSLQVDDVSNFSGNRQIPFFYSSNKERQDKNKNPNIVIPSHRKESKRRRKKERRKKNSKKNQLKSDNSVEDSVTITGKQKKRYKKKSCSECKIKKRKGRNRNGSRRVSALTMRKILERVAEKTMSGARSGDGTINDLYEGASYTSPGKSSGGWSHEQHWVDIAAGEDLYEEQDFYQTDGDVSPWSSWTPCSTKCGPGQKERMRRCGSACKEVESMVCLNSACEAEDEETSDENKEAIEEFYKWEREGFVPPLKVPEPEYLDPAVDSCSNWVECSQGFADKFIQNSSLPGCPCSFPLRHVKLKELWDSHLNRSVMWVDASSHNDLVYKPGAENCIRSKLATGAVTLAVQQCCYDNGLSLVTRGKSAGTPNLISPEISKELHYKVDLLPWVICKGDWTRYNQVMPPNNAIQCTDNPSDDVIEQQKHDVSNY